MASISALLVRVDALKSDLDALRPLDRELEERVLQKFRLWWTYHSNAIEGNHLTQGETEMFLMEGLTAKGKPLKDHLDLRGHSNAINYLLAFIREKEVLTEAAIRKLHEVLLVESYQVPAISPEGLETRKTVALGEYKSQPNHVRTPTGEIHYYATPLETPAKMQELIAWQRAEYEKRDLHPVEIAAQFHHRFTAIHPFDDGNGRMARLLMNLLLMQVGYPPVVIRLGERDEYLTALRFGDAGDVEPLTAFVVERVIASIDLYLGAARGEEIHEPTDVEKEIALLKLELQHIEEPDPLGAEAQTRLFDHSFDPLFREIKRVLLPLFELFSNVQVSTNIGASTVDFATASSFPTPHNSWREGNVFNGSISYFLALNGFKKAGLEPFDVSREITLRFEALKYAVEVRQLEPPLKFEHFYQQQLSPEEISEIAQALGRFFLGAIRKKTGNSST